MEIYDCIIVGGGPAGLNAAIVLGRCRRKVLIFDTEQYRNRYSHGIHNYLTRDDILPHDFLQLCQKELEKYSIQKIHKKVINAKKNDDDVFVVKDENGTVYYSKKLLIATGLIDTLPDVESIRDFYGKSVFHCPYCDGWEVRDKKIGVYARNKEGWELALALKGWSDTITLYTDGKNKVKPFQKEYLDVNEIAIVRAPIAKLHGTNGILEKIIFKNGEERDCDALFFVNGYSQQCNIAEAFGCEVSKKGVIVTNRVQQTNIKGLYVAGDASKDMQFVVVAGAEGAKAGVTINKELQKEIYEKKLEESKVVNKETDL
ncbi:MAG TPA: NAD(P)/FAD-dependent oxidoreductase [Flavisolibacter sp.]|jgi:thioredoxin reductase|nr:NAD(P)/FAD-dependent oxidoreductase [Flavisolibacter sp.]